MYTPVYNAVYCCVHIGAEVFEFIVELGLHDDWWMGCDGRGSNTLILRRRRWTVSGLGRFGGFERLMRSIFELLIHLIKLAILLKH